MCVSVHASACLCVDVCVCGPASVCGCVDVLMFNHVNPLTWHANPPSPLPRMNTASLPKSDFVYHVAEMASLALAGACVVLMSTRLKSTYQKDVDSFGALHVPTEFGTVYILVPCLLLAMVRTTRALLLWFLVLVLVLLRFVSLCYVSFRFCCVSVCFCVVFFYRVSLLCLLTFMFPVLFVPFPFLFFFLFFVMFHRGHCIYDIHFRACCHLCLCAGGPPYA